MTIKLKFEILRGEMRSAFHDVSENKWVSCFESKCHSALCPSNKDSYEISNENKEAAYHDVTETKGVSDDSRKSSRNLPR